MEKRCLFTVFVILCFFMISAMLPAAVFAEAVGSFSRVEGRVDMLKEGKGSAIIVKAGDSVSMGDIVRTKSDGKAEILFKDKTTVRLAPETRIKIDEYTFNPDNSRKQGIIGLLRGKIRAVVSKAKVASIIPVSTGTSTFSVQTPTATAGVKGTDFFIFYDKGITGVLFKEGMGFIYNTNMPGKIVNISAGQITYILKPNTPPLPPRQVTEAELRQHIKDSTVEEPVNPEGKTKETALLDIASSSITTETVAGGVEGYAEQTGEITGTLDRQETEITTLLPVTETAPETLADTIPPQIDFKLAPPLVTNASSAYFNITSDEPVSFIYSLDGGAPVATSGTLNFTGLTEGTHVIQVTATDSAGNTSTGSYTWFCGQRDYDLGGSIIGQNNGSGSGSIGTATGDIVAISNQNWGGWSLSMSGNAGSAPSSSWTLLAGGKGYDDGGSFNGYWLDKTDGTASANILSGTSYLQYLSYYMLGTGTGILNGTYDDLGNWQATDVSLNMYTETPLAFVSEINYDAYKPMGEYLYLYSLFGGTESIWTSSQASPANVTWMGEYSIPGDPFRTPIYSYNYTDNTYTTYDGGAYYGFMGRTDINNTLESAFYALYIDPSGNTGILTGSLTGTAYPDLSMFEAEGGIYPTQITSTAVIPAERLYYSIVDKTFFSTGDTDFKFNGVQMGIGLGRGYSYRGEFLSIGPSAWGIWNTRTSGSYSGISVSDNWNWSQEYNDGSTIFGTETTGTQWSGGQLAGSSVGYGAEMTPISTSTWISAGETIGTFDAAAQTVNALTMGTFLETNQFLQMTATAEGRAALQQLNIPFAEVGRASFTGTDGNLTINMNDVIFFAYSNGSAPNIWATSGVSGSYITDPAVTSVALSGNGLSAEFNLQQWTGGNWMSTVTGGGGTYSGTGTLNGSTVQFNGAAAGTYGSGTFSGTGAGVTK